MAVSTQINVGDDYKEKYGFFDAEKYVFKAKRGLSEEVVKEISWMKSEPDWMTQMRLRSLRIFEKKTMPTWGADLSVIDFDNIFYYLKASEGQGESWDEVPDDIKRTFDRLGVPEAERKFLAGVAAQYESEVVYHSLHKDLEKKGVIFLDTDTGLREHPEIFREYFGTIIPPADNKFAALNTAVWSGGSFIYVPKGVRVDIPLQAYFRINAENMGQFERTLIICDEGSFVHYIEGCTAPIYTTDSLHSAVVEIIVKRGARCRYTTIQNWSTNVYNLVTKRAAAYAGATMEWVDGNLGCLAAGTRVFTNNSVKTIEEVDVGDFVYSLTNRFDWVTRRVLATKVNPPRATWRMTTADDRDVVATDNHPFLVRQKVGSGGDVRWLPLSGIRVGDEIAVSGVLPDEAPAHEPALAGAVGGRGMHPSQAIGDNREGPEVAVCFSKVMKIEEAGEQPTYDIEVEGTCNFIANGILAHNSQITMKYPSVYLMEPGAKGDVLSVAFAGKGQHQDAGGKMVHVAPHTTSTITSKSISKAGGRTSYRGLIKVHPGAHDVKSFVKCDALLLDDESISDTYPYIECDESDVNIGHEATVSKVSDEQLFYVMSRGIPLAEAESMIVNGFIEPFTKELPLEYAIELNRLIQLEMEGSVG